MTIPPLTCVYVVISKNPIWYQNIFISQTNNYNINIFRITTQPTNRPNITTTNLHHLKDTDLIVNLDERSYMPVIVFKK